MGFNSGFKGLSGDGIKNRREKPKFLGKNPVPIPCG
jgi:hypothetical protein